MVTVRTFNYHCWSSIIYEWAGSGLIRRAVFYGDMDSLFGAVMVLVCHVFYVAMILLAAWHLVLSMVAAARWVAGWRPNTVDGHVCKSCQALMGYTYYSSDPANCSRTAIERSTNAAD